uniref:Putative ovule protein n=1 Tax=Solanum chacoense TaxID=4108 RepID=A0A0V0HAY4_SOLCH
MFSVPVGEQFQEFGSLFSAKYSTNGDGSVDTGIGGREYLLMSDEELMKQCELSTFKASGPGGQHRNKRESAVRLKHSPTGIIAQAVEDRSQHMNRASALSRLRVLLALKGIPSTLCCSKMFLPEPLPYYIRQIYILNSVVCGMINSCVVYAY